MAPSRPTGPPSRSSRPRPGTSTASSASSSIGASTRCPPSATSGTRGTCTRAATKEFAHHVATYGPQSTFGYKDFIPSASRPRSSTPGAGPRCSRRPGARYVVPVAEHHDGFPMYDCSVHRVVGGEDGPEARRRGRAGRRRSAPRAWSSACPRHRVEHWWFFDQGHDLRLGRAGSAVRRPLRPGPRPEEGRGPERAPRPGLPRRLAGPHRRARGQVPARSSSGSTGGSRSPPFHPNLQTFAAFYYNRGAEWGKGVAINYKKHGGESFPDTAGVLDIERGQLAAIRPLFWQTDTSVSKTSWGYVTNHEYKTVDSHRGRPRGHREQERQPAPEHRPAARRHHSGDRGERCCATSASGWP